MHRFDRWPLFENCTFHFCGKCCFSSPFFPIILVCVCVFVYFNHLLVLATSSVDSKPQKSTKQTEKNQQPWKKNRSNKLCLSNFVLNETYTKYSRSANPLSSFGILFPVQWNRTAYFELFVAAISWGCFLFGVRFFFFLRYEWSEDKKIAKAMVFLVVNSFCQTSKSITTSKGCILFMELMNMCAYMLRVCLCFFKTFSLHLFIYGLFALRPQQRSILKPDIFSHTLFKWSKT